MKHEINFLNAVGNVFHVTNRTDFPDVVEVLAESAFVNAIKKSENQLSKETK